MCKCLSENTQTIKQSDNQAIIKHSNNQAIKHSDNLLHETLNEPDSRNHAILCYGLRDRIFTATMEQNSTAEAFRALLPLTLEMQELNGNEKYHYLSQALPTNRTKVGTIHAGDIMLYGDNCVVVFYETFTTSYQYTPIGHITNPKGLKEALGIGSVTINFTSKIKEI